MDTPHAIYLLIDLFIYLNLNLFKLFAHLFSYLVIYSLIIYLFIYLIILLLFTYLLIFLHTTLLHICVDCLCMTVDVLMPPPGLAYNCNRA